ncbi:PIR protein [Plasmodium vivax]|nr:PIR protein [Plasmodium vivax]
MARWPGVFNIYSDSFRRYKEPECINNYDNFQKEIKSKITALRDPQNFCTKCQKIKQDIINKNNQLNDCYTHKLLRNRLINDDEIKKFMGNCLESPNCSYNGTSNIRKSSALKREPAKVCRGKNDCNEGATSVQVLANKAQPVLNAQSPEIKLPVRQEERTIKQPHTEGAGSTKANTNSFPQNNISNPNNHVVVQHGAPHSKGILPSGTIAQESIPKPAASASLNSLTSALGSSSHDSSPHVTPGSDSSTNAIAQQQNLETSSHESDQHSPQHVNSNPLSAQNIGRPTSQEQGAHERSLNGEDGAAITLSGRNHGNAVVDGTLHRISNLDAGPSLFSEFTDDTAVGEKYLNGDSLETSIHEQLIGESTGDNSEIKYKNYTAMALAPTGVIMLMTLLSKYTSLGMLFTKKRRNTRKDIRQNIERILLLESPAKTEERSISFAYSPQYWEK